MARRRRSGGGLGGLNLGVAAVTRATRSAPRKAPARQTARTVRHVAHVVARATAPPRVPVRTQQHRAREPLPPSYNRHTARQVRGAKATFRKRERAYAHYQQRAREPLGPDYNAGTARQVVAAKRAWAVRQARIARGQHVRPWQYESRNLPRYTGGSGPVGTPGGPTHLVHGSFSFSRGFRNLGRAIAGYQQAKDMAQLRGTATDRAITRLLIHPGRSLGDYSQQRSSALTGFKSPLATLDPVRQAEAIGYTIGHPSTYGKTLKGLAELPLGAVPGTIQAVTDPVGAYNAYTGSMRRYYGGTHRQFIRRVQREGGTQAIIDTANLIAPTGASLGRGISDVVPRGSRVGRFLNDPRPNLRVSGSMSRRQELSPNAFRAAGQRGQDRFRVYTAARRAGRRSERPVPEGGHGRSGLVARSNSDFAAFQRERARRHAARGAEAQAVGNADAAAVHYARAQAAHHLAERIVAQKRPLEVVAASKVAQRRAIRVAVSQIQTRHFQRFRNEHAAEIDRGLKRALSELGPGFVGGLKRDAAQFVIRGLVSAKDPKMAVAHLHDLRDAVMSEFHGQGFAGEPPVVKQIDRVIHNADRIFGPKFETWRQREVARIARVRQGDLGVRDATAELHPHRGPAFVMGVEHPYDAAVRRIERGVPPSPERMQAIGRRVGELQQEFGRHAKAAQAHLVEAGRLQDAGTPGHQASYAEAEREWALAERARSELESLRSEANGTSHEAQQAALDALDAQKPEMDRQFIASVKAAADRTGRPLDPAYIKDFKHRSEVETRAAHGMGSSGRPAPGVQQSELSLLSSGRNDYSPEAYVQSVALTIKRKHNWAMYSDQFRAHGIRPPTIEELRTVLNRDRNLTPDRLTADDWKTILEHRGEDTRDWAIFNPGTFLERRRAADEHQLDVPALHEDAHAPAGEVLGSVMDSVANFPSRDGRFDPAARTMTQKEAAKVRGVHVFPRAALNEIAPGGTLNHPIGRFFDKTMGLQARYILGWGGIVWAPIQAAANLFLSAIAVGGNPLAFTHGIREWNRLPPEVRQAADELFGTGLGEAAGHRVRLGAAANSDVVNAGRAFNEAARLRSRALIDQVPGLRRLHLNPVELAFQFDAAQNAYFKRVVFTTKLKREMWADVQRNSGLGARAWAQVHDLLLGAPRDALAKVAAHPQAFDRAAQFTNDVLGDYVRYTARERRTLKRFVLFYGFMRYALRMLFYTMPVKHPIVAGVVAKLAQLHNDEVKELLGGDQAPWAYSRIFFTKPGIGGLGSILSLDPQEAKRGAKLARERKLYSIDTARMNPVTTPISDVASEGLKAGGNFIAPMMSTLLDQVYSTDAFTGQPLTRGTNPEAALGWGIGDALQNAAGSGLRTYLAPVRYAQQLAAHGRRESSTSIPLLHPQYLQYAQGGTGEQKANQRQADYARSGRGLPSTLLPLLWPTLDTSRDIVAQRKRQAAQSKGRKRGGGGFDPSSAQPAGTGATFDPSTARPVP